MRNNLRTGFFGDNMFGDLLDGISKPFESIEGFTRQYLMKTDIKEHDDKMAFTIDLPGVKKEDVRAELDEGNLIITATRNSESTEQDADGKYIRRERFIGAVSRSFYVGEDVKQEDIKAKFENGILKLEVPKVECKEEPEQKNYITIE